MSFILTTLFVIWIIVSAFMQAEDNPKKNFVSPALTAACGILVLVGALAGNVPQVTGIVLAAALLLLFLSDFTFERSVKKAELFPLAMIFGVLSGFTIGVLLNLQAVRAGTPVWLLGVFALAGVSVTVFVYRFLAVPPDLKIPIYIYLVQAVILLTGGLASLYAGNLHFAVWGIFIYISDTLVGVRAFPSTTRPIPWLDTRRILFAIIVLYYAAQFALVSWAL